MVEKKKIMIPFLKHKDTSNYCTNLMTTRLSCSWHNQQGSFQNTSIFDRNHRPAVLFEHQNCQSCFPQTFHLHYKIYGDQLVAWKHYYMQHAFSCIAVPCNCTTNDKYASYHNKRKKIVFLLHQLNSNWMYAVAYLLYHKMNVTGVYVLIVI